MLYFSLEFKLKTQKFQEDILDKRFKIGCQIYNSLVNVVQKRYKEMIKTKKYRGLIASLTDDVEQNKAIWKQIGEIRKECGFSEDAFHADVKPMQDHFKENIDVTTAQKIATSLWAEYKKLFSGKINMIYDKDLGDFNLLCGGNGGQSIEVRDDNLVWNGLTIPIMIDHNNQYEHQAMHSEICYSRVVRKLVRGKYKYYIQIVFKGARPMKLGKNGNVKKI